MTIDTNRSLDDTVYSVYETHLSVFQAEGLIGLITRVFEYSEYLSSLLETGTGNQLEYALTMHPTYQKYVIPALAVRVHEILSSDAVDQADEGIEFHLSARILGGSKETLQRAQEFQCAYLAWKAAKLNI